MAPRTADKSAKKEATLGWISHANLEVLDGNLAALGLSTRGTLNKKRQRLARHFRRTMKRMEDGTIPPSSGSDGEEEIFTLTASAPVEAEMPHPNRADRSDIELLRRWPIRFSGDSKVSVLEFLNKLEDLKSCYGVAEEAILRGLPMFLDGRALQWYRLNKEYFQSWDLFTMKLKERFIDASFPSRLEDEIKRRTQAPDEKFSDYVTCIHTLLNQLEPKPLNSVVLERVWSNAHPSYRSYIRRTDFTSLNQLIRLANEFEHNKYLEAQYQAPPRVEQSLVPETAFKDGPHAVKGGRLCMIYGKPNTTGNNRPKLTCWNCHSTEHGFRQCKKPRESVFCFRCGQKGVTVRSCDKCHRRPGNGTGVVSREGTTTPV